MTDFAPSINIRDEVMAFLLTSPTPQQIIDFRASDVAQERLRYLLDANCNGTLTLEEEAELEDTSNINHFMIGLKAKAHEAI
ncbi:MAG: hypothetical protein Phog2KO_12660 [Phototrophicaceae bacterium]